MESSALSVQRTPSDLIHKKWPVIKPKPFALNRSSALLGRRNMPQRVQSKLNAHFYAIQAIEKPLVLLTIGVGIAGSYLPTTKLRRWIWREKERGLIQRFLKMAIP
jgi:hypothetical protein